MKQARPVAQPVQPRVCGRDLVRLRCALRLAGSAPRVRERRKAVIGDDIGPRFSPACAGETSRRLARRSG